MKSNTEALEALEHLLEDYKTASLASIGADGRPLASYAPIAVDSERTFYLFVSELSEHTENLRERRHASLLFIEDESRSHQLFARNRLTVEGEAVEVPRNDPRWEGASEVYRARFGKFFDLLAALPDFHMIAIEPREARLVVGFGGAYRIHLPNWSSLELLTGR